MKIRDKKGNWIEVTDLKKAIQQAGWYKEYQHEQQQLPVHSQVGECMHRCITQYTASGKEGGIQYQ